MDQSRDFFKSSQNSFALQILKPSLISCYYYSNWVWLHNFQLNSEEWSRAWAVEGIWEKWQKHYPAAADYCREVGLLEKITVELLGQTVDQFSSSAFSCIILNISLVATLALNAETRRGFAHNMPVRHLGSNIKKWFLLVIQTSEGAQFCLVFKI